MAQLFADAARAYLSAGINNTDTTVSIAAGGSLFPVANGTDWFKAVLQDASGIEIVYVTAHTSASTSFTVTRGQEGTTARSFAAGSVFGLRVTAADTAAFAALRDRSTHTGEQAISTVTGLATALDGKENTGTAAAAVAAHEAAGDPHPQYQVDLVSGTNIKTINNQSILGAGNINIQSGVGVALSGDPNIYVTQSKTYTITNYNVFSSYVVQVSAGSVSLSGDQISFTAPATAQTVTLTVTMDSAATQFSLVVQAAGVTTPTNSSPSNGATDQNGTVTLTSSAFAWYGLSDTHLNSDWQLATDAGFTSIVQSTSADSTNKTSWTVSGLSTSQTYYWRVRHRGTNNGVSAWSTGTSFVTKATFGGLIGTAGGQGFGAGECPDAAWLTTLGLTAMAGTTDKASANYGNYQHANGGISVFVPKFYYRYGDAADPAYATYGAKTLTIKGIETFSGETAANVAGYALHRAFINNGVEVSGFFLDKYLASKDGVGSCKSVQNGVPISLTTSATYTNSNGMTGCTGILADAVVLSRARGAGWNEELVFMRDAIAKLTDSHAQHSTSATYCAWYDAAGVTNFPKGCNNNALADTNDATVTFTSAGDSGSANKPKTGSASNLAKTTHNGQACGIADVNGAMWQVLLGLTQAGTSATGTLQNTTGDAYVLKRTARHANLTGGFGGTTDAWGTTSSLATNFDLIAGFLPWAGTTGWNYFGNGANAVFSGATSGTDYLRSCSGIAALTGMSATGTNQFGNDGNYQYGVANLFPMASGLWGGAAGAGVFFRRWGFYRSYDDFYVGFRAAAYGN